MSIQGRAGVWDADVLVLGAGAWGSMAAWRLAADGHRVLVLERFESPHAHGSSHGLTRLFRMACLEHPGLTPIAARSLELYRELEARSGRSVVDLCGGLTVGPERGIAVPGVLAAAESAGLPVEVLDPDAVRARFPFHGWLAPDDLGVHDPASGVLRIETAVAEALAASQAHGAVVRSGVRVRGITSIPGGSRVETDQGSFRAPKVVVALGSWTSTVLPEVPLRLTRMPMTWFEARPGATGAPAALAQAQVFIREIGTGGGYWGHGAPDGELAKVGPRGAVARGDEPSVDGLDRTFRPVDAAPAEDAVRRYLPSLVGAAARGFVCHSTRTPDEQFILGAHPTMPDVIVAAGESGHGGKHAAGVGDIAAALATGRDPGIDIDFLRPDRFALASAA